jgi:patatin-related protein
MGGALGNVADAEKQELRLAVVMTGGVSLAVWMGGVAHELNRLVRADGDIYRRLLELTATTARVDVIAGTSAGGLNGALLAMAQIHDADMIAVRDLWLDKGALEMLLRSPRDQDPPSLMRGDEYFLPGIQDGLKALVNRRECDLPEPDAVPVHLIITSTLLDGMHRGMPDHFGSIIHDRDHRGEFVFRRGGGLVHHSKRCAHAIARARDDDFAEPETINRIALAARSTASFPFAFEPSYCPVGDGGGDRPDEACHAHFSVSRYVVDGGVLVNQPLGPALRAIFDQQAKHQVRRLLAFVVPDPGTPVRDEPAQQGEMPSLAEVAYASLLKLPRNQSIFNDLDQLRTHNARVAGQRRRRQAAAASGRGVVEIADPLYERYRRTRAEWLADLIVSMIARGAGETGPEIRPGSGDLPLWDRPALRRPLLEHLAALPPAKFPREKQPVELWFTTLDTVERAGAFALDMLARPLRFTNPRDASYHDRRAGLGDLRENVHAALRQARRARPPARPAEEQAAAIEALQAIEDGRLDVHEAKRIVERALGDPRDLAPFMRQIAHAVRKGAPIVRDAAISAKDDARIPDEPADEALTLAGVFLDEHDRVVDANEVLRRMLSLEVVQMALADQPPAVEQAVELLQLSADAPNGFDTRATAAQKLAGLQLAHFGAFYKRSWRANDWMWGRLDAAQRMASVLLDPSRLRQLAFTPEALLEEIKTIAFHGLSAEDRRTLERAQPMRWDEEAALNELQLVYDLEKRPPASLPMCAQAVARRLQLDILREELRPIADAVAADALAGSSREAAIGFATRVKEAGPAPAAKEIVALFNGCAIGTEKLSDEDGQKLMARTLSKAGAVTTSALSGQKAGLGDRMQRLRRGLRGAGLAVYLTVRNALVGTRPGAMAVTAAMAAGAALLAIGLIVGHSGAELLGALLLLGGLGSAALVGRWREAARLSVAAAALALLPRLVLVVADQFTTGHREPGWAWDALDRFEGIWVIAILVGAAVWLGNLSIDWPQEDEPEPHSPAAADSPAAALAVVGAGVGVGVIDGLVDALADLPLAIAGVAGLGALVAARLAELGNRGTRAWRRLVTLAGTLLVALFSTSAIVDLVERAL